MASLDYQYIAQIAARATLGDSDAFAELYTATYQHLYHYAYHYLKDEYLAQDAISETYILTLKNIHTLKNPELFISWLNQICFRVCFSMQKKQQRYSDEINNFQAETIASDFSADTDIESQVIHIDEKEYIMRQIMSLPFSEAQAIIMRYYQNMTIDDISILMDTSRSSVKRYLARGQRRLRALLEH